MCDGINLLPKNNYSLLFKIAAGINLVIVTIGCTMLLFCVYRLVTIAFSLLVAGIGVSVVAETHHDILYAR